MVFSDTAINLTLKTTIQVDTDDYIIVDSGGESPAKDKQFTIPLLNAEAFRINDEMYFETLSAFMTSILGNIMTMEENIGDRKITVEYSAVEEE